MHSAAVLQPTKTLDRYSDRYITIPLVSLVAENLLKSEDAVWKEGFTECGKWMDGWETRRKVSRVVGSNLGNTDVFCSIASDPTMLDALLTIQILNLCDMRPGQYLDGRQQGHFWCCWHGFRYPCW